METQEGKSGAEGGKECCSKSKCCGCKALAALALVLLGGIGGFFAARHCGMCRYSGASAPTANTAPAQPTK